LVLQEKVREKRDGQHNGAEYRQCEQNRRAKENIEPFRSKHYAGKQHDYDEPGKIVYRTVPNMACDFLEQDKRRVIVHAWFLRVSNKNATDLPSSSGYFLANLAKCIAFDSG